MTAVISPCGRYRYKLGRRVAESGPVYAFFGVNPSTADAEVDDATVRKWAGFVRRWGGGSFIVGNVFAYRATDVGELAEVSDPFGPDNSRFLKDLVEDADILVPCWGARGKLPPSLRNAPANVLRFLLETGKPVKCFGFTACGSPRHPLMLAYETQLVEVK